MDTTKTFTTGQTVFFRTVSKTGRDLYRSVVVVHDCGDSLAVIRGHVHGQGVIETVQSKVDLFDRLPTR